MPAYFHDIELIGYCRLVLRQRSGDLRFQSLAHCLLDAVFKAVKLIEKFHLLSPLLFHRLDEGQGFKPFKGPCIDPHEEIPAVSMHQGLSRTFSALRDMVNVSRMFYKITWSEFWTSIARATPGDFLSLVHVFSLMQPAPLRPSPSPHPSRPPCSWPWPPGCSRSTDMPCRAGAAAGQGCSRARKSRHNGR